MVDWFERIAQAIADAVPRRNDILPAAIVANLGLTNNTPIVTVTVGDATRTAIWACPKTITVGKGCFVTRLSPDPAADWVVIATNYQAT